MERVKKAPPTLSQPNNQFQILVVEDNPINRMVAEGMLEQLGYNVQIAPSGGDCLTLCEQIKFDLILMDCNMPMMDGYTTTRRLRSQGKNKDIPIIALTANALSEHRQRCLDAGMNDHIAKPFNRQQIQNTLVSWLQAS